MTGHDLLQQAGALVALLEAPEGADADAISEALASWIDSTDDKLTAYWAVTRRLDAEAEQLRSLEQTLAKRRRYLDAQADRVKGLASELLIAREALGEEPKVKAPLYSAWLATTRSVEVSCAVEDLESCYQRVSIEVDKRALQRDLEVGKEVQGARLLERRGVRWR